MLSLKNQITLLAKTILVGAILSPSLAFANSAPVVNTPLLERDPIDVGEEISVQVTASDPDGDDLSYRWNAISGTITGNGNTASYIAPASYPIANLDTITVVVKDTAGNRTAKSEIVHIEKRNSPGEIYLVMPKQISAGDTFELKIMLNTNGVKSRAADIILSYPDDLLLINDADQTQSGLQIKNGEVFDTVTRNEIRGNKIYFSVSGDEYSSLGTLATISLTALTTGSGDFEFDFLPSGTNDTNLFANEEEKIDLLGTANGERITIGESIATPKLVKWISSEKKIKNISYPKAKKAPESGLSPIVLILIIFIITGGVLLIKQRSK